MSWSLSSGARSRDPLAHPGYWDKSAERFGDARLAENVLTMAAYTCGRSTLPSLGADPHSLNRSDPERDLFPSSYSA
ncbi:hypothetical protein ACVIHH_001817 [Bradyrhizobium sp. USDA 4518]